MSRTPYSPFVLKAMAPEPWNAGRAAAVGISCVRGGSSIPSDFVGIVRRGLEQRQRRATRARHWPVADMPRQHGSDIQRAWLTHEWNSIALAVTGFDAGVPWPVRSL